MTLYDFLVESNRIEGITTRPTDEQVAAAQAFISLNRVSVADVENIVNAFQPSARLRDNFGLDVVVGNHKPPRGGPEIRSDLERLLFIADAPRRIGHPYWIHHKYESLHPFTDGNGRSGRLLWLWGMNRRESLQWALRLGFLHAFYYQALEAGR